MENKKRNACVTLLLALSHILGLVRVILVSFLFGSGRNSDVLSYAFSLPNQMRKKIEEGSSNLALIRKYSDKEGGEISFFLLLFHIILLIFVFLFSRPLGKALFYFTGFKGPDAALGINLFTFFLYYLALFNAASNINAYIIARGRKMTAAALTMIPSLCAIVFLLALSPALDVYSFSSGLLAGSLIYLIASLIFALSCGMRIRLTLHFEKRFVFSYLTSISLVVLSIIEVLPPFLAAARTEKASIYFSNAYSLLLLPYSFLLEIFTLLIYPELTRGKDLERKKENALFMLSFFSFALFLLLSSFSSEISVFLFFGGNYTLSDALSTAKLLEIASPSIFFLALYSCFQRMMFITLDSKSVMIASFARILSACVFFLVIPSSLYKAPVIFTLSSLIACALCLLFSSSIKKMDALRTIGVSIFSAMPLVILRVLKFFIHLDDFITKKIAILFASLFIGLIFLLLSLLLYFNARKKLGFLRA